MITVENLTKRFGTFTAVDTLSFDVPAGVVTGFIGPNGAGKSTTMRAILSLDRPTSGRALINGMAYSTLPAPARTVGAVLDPRAAQAGRTTRDHLRWAAKAAGVSLSRVDAALEEVGLAHVGDRKVAALSLGMHQRLAIAIALLGEPEILILDEPVNGLDPEGVVWVRDLLRGHAAKGGAVLVSSHLLHELQETADRVVLIAAGRLVAELTMSELTKQASGMTRVLSDDGNALTAVLEKNGGSVRMNVDGALDVSGIDSRMIGSLALEARIGLIELIPQHGGLEEAFLKLTSQTEAAS